MHRLLLPSNAISDLSADEMPGQNHSASVPYQCQTGSVCIRRHLVNFLNLYIENFKSTHSLKAGEKASPPGVLDSGTLDAVGGQAGTWGEDTGESF